MHQPNLYSTPPDLTMEMVLAKEKELEARREAINRRQRNIAVEFGPPPNFPPKFLCIKPQIYHNIKEQVPVPLQRFMYILCGLYMSLIAMIVYNIVCAFVNFLLGGSSTHFALSFVYLLGIPGAFFLWYYNAYCATTDNSQPRRLLAYLGLFFGLTFDVWMAVGAYGFGGCGWIITFEITSRVPAFIMCLISSILWSLHGTFLFVMLLRFWSCNPRSEGSRYELSQL
ncbi:putative membrane-trafficking protein [Trypanosoma rangeli]|uniref:Putative membrane-trafficking protein n=1 Tax=Trypanosoma rangeli TaxID=5698 RepID=A0A3R7KQ76_TRYRA|nr:putative membrane-trafficking protein [Trypanosoma rangeli]RNF11458.1 putative membrane-trafficking protein [Trypanosoma rangeli]|eukprot:RNF11458.1 putative membrane-trafficking protein [Trypanosoma rangeli]